MKKSIAILSIFLLIITVSCRDDLRFNPISQGTSEEGIAAKGVPQDSLPENSSHGSGDPEPPRKDLSQWRGTGGND
ncbi:MULTISPECIES: hypothetical protein [unclassified Kaistella]|uniref:hypothetical protein n=1 Tax=unclassified Kaistella TaxID=2762626 RepID=UPI0027336AC6|nr:MULTISPECIES: hypothetical protein [unclassified Kaistella]MDP2452504.1 hypothetical protein [Kaistella sp. SH11-4b]MDP2455412.1 hypothetical protein [Kaistella sp. SH40-3]MDP2458316.1 hypothetical protein [Kaistella sp. SH19-2b]